MAAHAICCSEVVITIDVAGSTGRRIRRRVRADQSKTGCGVVKRSLVCPGNHVVTLKATGDREGLLITGVGWIFGRVVGGQVAAAVAAIRRLNRQIVIPADVALGAGRHFTGRRHLVRVGQREARGAVIELSGGPCRNGVAAGASAGAGGEIGSHVIGHISPEGLCAVP